MSVSRYIFFSVLKNSTRRIGLQISSSAFPVPGGQGSIGVMVIATYFCYDCTTFEIGVRQAVLDVARPFHAPQDVQCATGGVGRNSEDQRSSVSGGDWHRNLIPRTPPYTSTPNYSLSRWRCSRRIAGSSPAGGAVLLVMLEM